VAEVTEQDKATIASVVIAVFMAALCGFFVWAATAL
jgi:hypothetical protein